MGIHGIYKEIGPGRRIALSKLALDTFEKTGRPLRIAIDTSIWLFQIQASKGGTNPALRTFYYRLLRLIALDIHPVFVFDGPNKPPFKRNKRTGPTVASIPDFLAKQLLKQFGFPIHLAPGEAEAECALLQREAIVDAVLSEDVDTLMFGSGLTIRNWSPQKTGTTPTHVSLYDAVETKQGPSALDRHGMILVALMSGGDYVPEGIPGCGPKTACEAAKAGFGEELPQRRPRPVRMAPAPAARAQNEREQALQAQARRPQDTRRLSSARHPRLLYTSCHLYTGRPR
jgi:Holliday junction resolvase YEN1